MRPADPDPFNDRRDTPTLFEIWMGMSPQEWDALGAETVEDDEPRLL